MYVVSVNFVLFFFPEKVGVSVKLKKSITVKRLFDRCSAVEKLADNIKDLVIVLYGGMTFSVPGSSTEEHKEVVDKQAVKVALCGLGRWCLVMKWSSDYLATVLHHLEC